jgi:hypothetical protein
MAAALLSDAALTDIGEALQWYTTRSRGAAQRFQAALLATLAEVERDPERFRVIEHDVRRAVLRSFPYSIYFRPAQPDGWAVIAVQHDRRDPLHWQARR